MIYDDAINRSCCRVGAVYFLRDLGYVFWVGHVLLNTRYLLLLHTYPAQHIITEDCELLMDLSVRDL